jgi:hypothetical protein
MPPSSRGLGHFPFTEVTGIRIPLGVFNSNIIKILFKPFLKSILLLLAIYGSIYTKKSS